MTVETNTAALVGQSYLSLPGPGIVADLTRASLVDDDAPVPCGRRGEVVVFAVDGICWPVLRAVCATANLCVPYRSAFPSTSLVSWLAAIGRPPGSHPVVGPVFAVRPDVSLV